MSEKVISIGNGNGCTRENSLWALAAEKGELQHKLQNHVNTVNQLQQVVTGMNEEIRWHKLESKWINHVPQVGEEMLRLLLEMNNDQEILELEGILQPLLMRRSELRSQLTKLREQVRAKNSVTET